MLYRYDHPEYFKDVPQPDYEKESGNIIIFGAGVNGAMVFAMLKKCGIKILCFGDDDKRKIGTEYFGYRVISREEMRKKYLNAVIIVTPYISGTLFEKFKIDGHKYVYDCAPLFLKFEINNIKGYISPILDVFHCTQTFLDRRSNQQHALSVVLTERCTLKCRECMAFVPYYKNPVDYDYDKLSNELDVILPTGAFPNIYLEGGEPLLYKNLQRLIKKLISFKEVERIWIITNGTVVPDEDILKLLKSPKIIVWISDYGKYSTKMAELKYTLKNNGTACHSTTQHWYQVNKACDYKRSDEETQAVYDCCCKGLHDLNPFLVKGKIYRCQFHARSEEFSIIPECKEDSVDVNTDVKTLKERLDKFFLRKNYMDACKYCCGRGYASIEVPVAEQVNGKIEPLKKIEV